MKPVHWFVAGTLLAGLCLAAGPAQAAPGANLRELVLKHQTRELAQVLQNKDLQPDFVDHTFNDGSAKELTPFMLAAAVAQSPDELQPFLDQGWPLDVANSEGLTPLMLAASFNPNLSVIKALVAAGASTAYRSYDKGNILHLAVWNSNPEILGYLLGQVSPELNWNRDRFFQTPLHLAVLRSDPRYVRYLLAGPASQYLLAPGQSDETALAYAAMWNPRPEVMQVLLYAAAKTGLQLSAENHTLPVHQAARWGNPEVLALLLKAAGPDAVNMATTHDGYPLLTLAARNLDHQVIRLMLDQGARLPDSDAEQLELLVSAAGNRNPEVLEILLAAGLKLKPQTWHMSTGSPLFEAAAYGSSRSLARLLALTPPLDQRDFRGRTLLHEAVRDYPAKDSSEILKLLLATDARRHLLTPDHDGNTPLHLACAEGTAESVQILLAAGADKGLQLQNHEGWTPLHFAAVKPEQDQGARLETLFKAGAGTSLAIKNNAGQTPLFTVVANSDEALPWVRLLLGRAGKSQQRMLDKQGDPLLIRAVAHEADNPGIVSLLLEHGAEADLAYRGTINQSLLHWAADAGKSRTLKLLLDAGIDRSLLNLQNFLKRTPLETAIVKRHSECVRLLMAAGAWPEARSEQERLLEMALPGPQQAESSIFRMLWNASR